MEARGNGGGEFDTTALRDLARKQQTELQQKRIESETGKEHAIDSITSLASQLSASFNEDVSKAYRYQCRLDSEVKRLNTNVQEFGRQLDVWRKNISEVNHALKDLGDVGTWSRKLQHDFQLALTIFQSISK